MSKVVLCKHCEKPEYYDEMRWLNGWCGCRSCYKTRFEALYGPYNWNDLNGERPEEVQNDIK